MTSRNASRPGGVPHHRRDEGRRSSPPRTSPRSTAPSRDTADSLRRGGGDARPRPARGTRRRASRRCWSAWAGDGASSGSTCPRRTAGSASTRRRAWSSTRRMRDGLAAFAVTYAAHSGIGTLPLVFFGTDAQKRRYLWAGRRSEWAAYCLTEPAAGSDAMGIRTGRRGCPTATGSSTGRSSSSPTPGSPTCSRSTPRSTARPSAPSSSSATRRG